ncbi:hypothetical protein HDU79_011047 [Rhizoclosmatium sp. JEL0117]|nr:hypothetical protein HDU79_011047 [Rhizoclosmatium sp. JEL0117]
MCFEVPSSTKVPIALAAVLHDGENYESHASSAHQALLDQKTDTNNTHVQANITTANFVVEKAVETVPDADSENVNMLNPNHFSIKGVSVK